MEGKSLAMAYCRDSGIEAGENPSVSGDIIAIDFGGSKSQTPFQSEPNPPESLLAPLDPFMAGDNAVEWHDAVQGLEAVRSILTKLDNGATVTAASNFEFGSDDDEELTEGVRYDLETLDRILTAARNDRTRFHLAFDI